MVNKKKSNKEMDEQGADMTKPTEKSSDIVLHNRQVGSQIYKLLIDNSNAAIFLSKSSGDIIDVNNAAEQMFGYTKDEFLQLGRQGILDHTDDNLHTLLTQRKETGKAIGELIGIAKNGVRFPIELTSSIFTDDFGEEFTCTIMQDITSRKKVEQEMLLMLNNTDESFLLLNKELLILNYNKKFKDLYEKYFNIIIEKGRSILSYVQPDRKKIVAEIYKQALLGNTMFSEIVTDNADGSKNYFTLKYSPSKCNEDDIIGVFVTAKNITTERNAITEIAERQALLEQAENTFREIFEKASDGIIIHEIGTGKLLDINEKACEILEAKKEYILTEDPEIFMADEAGFSFALVMEKVVKASEGEPQFFDWQCKSLNGNLNWLEVKLQKANIAGTDRILSHFRVINDRKNAEVQMELQRKDKEALINNTDDLIWSIDCDYRLIAANNAYLLMMDLVSAKPHRVGDSVMIDEFGESLNNKWKVYYQRALAGEKYSIEEEFIHPKTKKRSYELVSFNPIFKDENVIGVACYSKNITELTENQIAIKATNAELDNVMASSQDMICTVASDDRIVRVSAASEIILGYTPEELVGKFIFDFVYDEDKEKTKNHAQEVMAGQPKPNYYNRYVRKDGSLVYLEWTAKWDEKSGKRYGVARDVTAKVEAENKLRLSEQRFKSLVQDGGDMIAIIDAEANYSYVSPTSYSILGYKPEEFELQNAFDFIHPDDVEMVHEQFGLLEHTKKLTLQPFRFKHKNGGWRWIETSVTNLMDEPAIKGFVANSRDITDRITTEEALSVTKENYKNLFENSPAPMFIFDFETLQIIDCNIETLLKYGYTKEEFLQLTIKDIRPEEDINIIESAVKTEQAYGQIHKNIWRHKKKSGEIMYMDISGHLITYDNRRVSLVMLIDVTEKLKMEEEKEFEKRDKEALINSTDDLIWSVGKDLKLIAANQAYLKNMEMLTGLVVGPGSDMIMDGYFPEPFIDFWKNCYLRALSGESFKEEIYNEAFHLRSERWLEVNFNPIRNGNEIIGLACNSRDITERKRAEEKIKHSNQRYEHVTKATYDAIWEWDIKNNSIYRAEGFERSFGFDLKELNKTETAWENYIHPDDRHEANESIQSAIQSNKEYWSYEYRLIKPNGEQAYVEDRAYILRNGAGEAQRIIGALRDITERKYYHDLEILERDVLEKNTQGEKSIEEVIEKYIVGIQKLHPGMLCSTQKFENNRLYNLSSPDLPKEFLAAINGKEIGDNEGSCGTAAFLKEKVIVSDIETDIRWAKYKETALKAGLRACWSHPIFDSKNNVSATFAVYYQTIKTPTSLEENTINRAANILQTILESYHREAALFESNQRYLNVTKATFDAIWDWDIANNHVYWGETHKQLFGDIADDHLTDTEKVYARLHPDERDIIFASAGAAIEGTDNNWTFEHRYLKEDNTYAYVLNKALIVRDENGIATRVFGAMQDISKQKEEEQHLKLMSSVVTSTSDAVLITEAEPLDYPGPKIIFANKAFCEMTGYTAEELIGKSPRILQGPKTDRLELQRVGESLRKWEVCEATVINYKKNGEEFWINFTLSPVANEKGWFTHWISVERDVTERKNDELQKELLRKIRVIFNEPFSINDTLYKVLKDVTLFGEFSFAESWLLSADKKEIKRATYYVADAALRQTLSRTSTLNIQKKGEGLVGTAWQTLDMQLWEKDVPSNIVMDEHVLINAGLKKLYALPFLNNSEIIGVLVFALDKNENSIIKLENLFNSLKSYLGAEIKRKQLEQELNQIFNFAPDIITIVGNDGYFKKINPAACELLEYSQEELLAKPFNDFVHPDDKNKTGEELKEIVEGKVSYYFENRYITKSGKIKWLAWTSTPSVEDDLIFAVAKNITEKKELEVVLEKANQMARIGTWELDIESKTLYWSDITKEIHETPPGFVPTLENATAAYKDGSSRKEMIKRIENAVDHGASWDIEVEIITQKGNLRWIRAIGGAEFMNGKCIKVFGSTQDIDERKRAEENIRSSEERRELIMNAALDAIICIDSIGDTTFWNPQAESIFGWKEQEVIGKKLTEFIIPERYRKPHEQGMKNYFETGKGNALNVLLQLSAVKKTGEEFPIELTVLPIEQNGKEFFCAFVRDITERKLSETKLLELNTSLQKQTQELALSNQELEQFAYVASHDLQEPLRMVSSFLTQLEKKYEDLLDEKGKKYIYFAVDGAKRMRQIILDLLEFSRIGRTDDLRESINLNDIVAEIKILYSSKIREQKAIINSDNLPVISSFKSPVKQVFQNLISNSLKYCKPNNPCKIHISATATATHWEFSVKDNGIGINKDYFDKIFVIFQRLHTKETYSGTGMGLSVTKKIIESLNGKIWVESVEGEGSVFFFTIPNT